MAAPGPDINLSASYYRVREDGNKAKSGDQEPLPTWITAVFITVTIIISLFFVSSSTAVTARLAVGEFLCNKPSLSSSPSNLTDDILFDRLSNILVIPIGFLHVPAHIYLMLHLYKFLREAKGWPGKYKGDIKEKMKKFVTKKIGRSSFYVAVMVIFMATGLGLPPICIARIYIEAGSGNEHCSHELATITKVLTHTFHFSSLFTNVVVVLVRLLMIFFTVVIGVIWRKANCDGQQSTGSSGRSQNRHQPTGTASSSGVLQNLRQSTGMSNRSGIPMGVVNNSANSESRVSDNTHSQATSTFGGTLDSGGQRHAEPMANSNGRESGQQAVNSSGRENREQAVNSGGQEKGQPISIAFEKVSQSHAKHLHEYELRAEKARPIYRIFRSFFVLQWIIHLFQLFFHIAHLLRPWIRKGQVEDAEMLIVTQQLDQLCYVIFNGLALVITHICGLKMNAYMRRYIREIHRKRFKSIKSKIQNGQYPIESSLSLEYTLTHLTPIKEESVAKSTFTPRIPGTGLGISITNPGFMVGIVLSIFALIGAMIKF